MGGKGRSRAKRVAKPTPTWKEFEKTIAEIQRQLAPTEGVVICNDSVLGESGQSRQCDVTVRGAFGPHRVFVVIECKKQKRPVALGQVECFAGKLSDVRATQGVLVSASQFSRGAKAVAKQHSIALMSYREAREADWSDLLSRVATPLGLVLSEMLITKCDVETVDGETVSSLPRQTIFVGTQGETLSLEALVSQCWTQVEKHGPGQGKYEVDLRGLFLPSATNRALTKLVLEIIVVARLLETGIQPAQGYVYETAETNEVQHGVFETSAFEWRELIADGKGRMLSVEEYRHIASQSPVSWDPDSPNAPKRFLRWKIVQTSRDIAPRIIEAKAPDALTRPAPRSRP